MGGELALWLYLTINGVLFQMLANKEKKGGNDGLNVGVEVEITGVSVC